MFLIPLRLDYIIILKGKNDFPAYWQVEYMSGNYYFPDYILGSAEWIDNDNIKGENINGRFTFNVHRVTPDMLDEPI